MKKFDLDLIISPTEFNKILITTNELIDKVSEYEKEIIDLKEEMNSSNQDRFNFTESATIESEVNDIITTVECSNSDITLNLGSMEFGQRVIVSKLDSTEYDTILVLDEPRHFWNGLQEIRLTSQFDTVTFMRLKDNLVIGI